MEASFSSRIDTPLILPQPIDLALRIDVVVLHVGRESFECVYLLEDDEIALIAALDGEERLPSSKGIERALWPILESIQWAVIREEVRRQTHVSKASVLLRPKSIEMLVLPRTHEPIEQLRFLLVCPMSGARPAAAVVSVRVIYIWVGIEIAVPLSAFLASAGAIGGLYLLSLRRGRCLLPIDGLCGQLMRGCVEI